MHPSFVYVILTDTARLITFASLQTFILFLNAKAGREVKMKLLVGYDELNVDKRSLELSQKYANAFNADVYIMMSLEQRPTLQKDDIEEAEDKLEKLKVPFNKDNINCETLVSVNYLTPGEDLVQFARDNDIDLVFIGIKKKSKVGKMVFGSNAQYVILNAPCPVVTVQ